MIDENGQMLVYIACIEWDEESGGMELLSVHDTYEGASEALKAEGYREFWPFMPQIETEALKVWVSRDYLAVLYRQRIDGRLRLTVNRTRRDGRGWRDGITWDELQRVKNETIGPKFWCAEAYPPEDRVVNVANMRHLWVLEEPGHIGAVAFPTESFWKKGL